MDRDASTIPPMLHRKNDPVDTATRNFSWLASPKNGLGTHHSRDPNQVLWRDSWTGGATGQALYHRR